MNTYILGAARTPIGSFLGQFSTLPASRLGAIALRAAVERSGVSKDQVEEVFMGHVLGAGAGQAPARQAALFAELPESVPCTTVNKVCGSGLQAVILGHRSIQTADNNLVAVGGMENMGLAPHLLMSGRVGVKFGSTEVKDAMQWDGLWDVYSDRAMGNCAEECVDKFNFSREELDAYAIDSFNRAQKATEAGIFASEITPVTIKDRKGEQVIETDEGPYKANFTKIPELRPAFTKDGKITAANASTINDGAAALIIGGEKFKDKAKFRIISHGAFAQNPTWFTTAPVGAMKKCLEKSGLTWADIDLYEINEAFAAVSLACIRELELDREKVNIYGGAISLGHPIGCSGARILVTLMNALEREKKRYGMASLCIGGGEGLAMIIERLN